MRALVLAMLFVSLPVLGQTTVAGSTPGSFRVTESGAAEYRIPIRVPPGIAGMEPRLALGYNSQAGNGLLGVGWDLDGLSAIGRCPRTLAQDGVRSGVNYDANDRFCLDGQRLMAISGTYGADGTEYRTERETFTKVISYGTAGSGPAWFKAWTKSGQIVEYGNTADSRIEAQGKSTVRVWAQNKVSDTNGNYLTVSYTENGANGEFRPARVDYGANSVQFFYETRTDAAPAYQAGSIIKATQRLRHARTYVGANQVRSYRIDYETSPATAQSRSTGVQECLPDGTTCFAATAVAFPASSTGFAGSAQDLFSWPSLDFSSGKFVFGDINGDGRLDLVVSRFEYGIGEVRYALWEGGGYGAFTTLFSLGGPYDYSGYAVSLGDINGDGKADLLRSWSTNGRAEVHYALSTGSGFDAFLQVIYWDGPYNFSSYRFHLADIDGDGRADLFVTRNEYGKAEVAYRLWTGGGFGASSTVIDWSGPYDYTWHGFQFPDIDGDGRADLVITRAEDGRAQVDFALFNGSGFGAFQNVFTWDGPYNYTGYSYQFADANGDGKADLFVIRADYYPPTGTAYALLALSTGQSFGAFATIFDWGSGPYDLSAYRFQLADLNGDGRADLVSSRAINGRAEVAYALSRGDSFASFVNVLEWNGADYSNRRFHCVDITGRGRADLFIGTADNSSGAAGAWRQNVFTTADLPSAFITSAGSAIALTWKTTADSSVHVQDGSAAYPTVDLAASFHVIAGASVSDGIGGTLSTAHMYGGLKAESGTGRGLLGFRWTEATEQATGLKSRTESRQDWPYVGLPSLVKKMQSSGAVLSEATSTYSCINPATGGACTVSAGNRYFPFASQSVETGNDLNGAVLPTVTTTASYDNFGNATSVVVSTGDGYSKTTTNTFANDVANWFLGRLTRSTVQSVTP
jgi:hypothetical protein